MDRSEAGGALVDAIEEGEAERVRTLLTAHPDLVNQPLGEGMMPLHAAVRSGARSVELLEVLLAAGADVAATSDGWTAMHWGVDCDAPYAGDGEAPEPVLTRLVEAGADLEARAPCGSTPLMRAVVSGSVTEVEALLGLGADPDRTFTEDALPEFLAGETLLEVPYCLPRQYQVAMLAALLAAGADPRRRNEAGLTAREAGERTLAEPEEDMDAAFLAGVRECVEVLREAERR